MDSTPTPERFTLRQLPIPAKLVISAFLISVGIGYFSALIQLHFQHASKGNAMPLAADVVARFSGVTYGGLRDADMVQPVCKLQQLLEAPETLPFNGAGQMSAAFTKKSDDWKPDVAERGEDAVRKDREGERLSLLAWIKAGAPKDCYENDRFPKPAGVGEVTKEYVDGGFVKVRSILQARCARCHEPNGAQGQFPLDTFDCVSKYLKVEQKEKVDPAKAKQIPVERLAQSTHVHLLGFAMLFALTGGVIAFGSFPGWVRAVLAPLPLVAQLADISCWWLARLPDVGPYFALAVMGTGGLVGLGVMTQIVLGLFDLYGRTGKLVLVLLFLVAAGGGYVVKSRVLDPHLEDERLEVLKEQEKANGKKPDGIGQGVGANVPGPKNGTPQPKQEPKQPEPKQSPEPKQPEAKQPEPKAAEVGLLQKLLEAPEDRPFKSNGSMAAAFTRKSDDWKPDVRERGEDVVRKDREGERRAILAWIKAGAPKDAYEKDRFPKPADVKEITATSLDGGAVKIKTIFNDRCARCHASGSEQEDHPLENYEQISKYLSPAKAAGGPAQPAPAPAPKPELPRERIPAAKD